MNMKTIKLITLALLCSAGLFAQNNSVLGDWYTVDDNTGEQLSIVHIYKADNGKYYGKITKLLTPGSEDELCVACEGEDKNKPILGMVIIRDMKMEDGVLTGGKVLDPDNGKFYYAKVSVGEDGRLKLRGSLDRFGALGRSQYWIRVK